MGNSRNFRRLFGISAGFGKSDQKISNFPSHSQIIWGGKLRKIEINLERKHFIIEKSPASYYSQVHIAPKPGGFRFCIDFRKLNDATESASWPILNIQQMLIRIGAHNALIYGIMDLTSGYHQAPISFSTRSFIYRVYYIRWYISIYTSAFWSKTRSIILPGDDVVRGTAWTNVFHM